MNQLLLKFLAAGLVFLLVFFVLSFFTTVVALRVGGKSAKAENGTWINALRATSMIYLVAILSIALAYPLSLLQQSSKNTALQTMSSLLALGLSLSALVASIYIIKRVFDLSSGETVKAIIISIIVNALLNGVLFVIGSFLFFGAFFKTATNEMNIDTKNQLNTADSATETSKPKLPSLTTAETAPPSATNDIKCKWDADCNQVDELCFNGICQTTNDIKKSFGFSENEPYSNTCLARPCPNCESGAQYLSTKNYSNDSVNFSAPFCADCLWSKECKSGFNCKDARCVSDLSTKCSFKNDCHIGFKCISGECAAETSNPANNPPLTPSSPNATPIPTPAILATDPESLKRDDVRISEINFLKEAFSSQASTPAGLTELQSIVPSVGQILCAPSSTYKAPLPLGSIPCDTSVMFGLTDGFALATGLENFSKANFDSRALPPLSNSTSIADLITAQSKKPSTDTLKMNLLYMLVIPFERKGQ